MLVAEQGFREHNTNFLLTRRRIRVRIRVIRIRVR
jgi:hypothetical protein